MKNTTKENKVTKDMKVMEIIENYPEAVPILMGYGLHCIGCVFSEFDTLETGAKTHGIDNETIDMMVRDVNEIIREGERKD